MQLRRIEVRDFRRLRHVAIRDLRDGLNVVVGDNEAGKSTLLAALRAALFEKHRVTGEAAQRMLPFGEQVRPEVAIDFELKGQTWQLFKAFCQRPEAQLEGPGERLTGDAVEERLAELLGFTPPGRGGSKPEEHQGAYGLLWVEQGAAHRSLGVGAGRESIASALESEVGQVLGGERGRVLLSAAEDRRADHWTKMDRPRGTWKALQEEVESLGAEQAKLERELLAYDGKIAELERRQEAMARHAREDSLARAEREHAATREAMTAAERLEEALQVATEIRERAGAQREIAAERLTTRRNLIARAEAAVRGLHEAEERAKDGRRLLEVHDGAARRAAERYEEVAAELTTAEETLVALEEAAARTRAEEELVKLDAQLAACADAEARRRAAVAEAEAARLSKRDLAEIEELARGADRARARKEAASVRIEFVPDAAGTIMVDGRVQAAEVPLSLARDAEVILEGFGVLRVRPGGGVTELAREAEEATQLLAERLRALGVADQREAQATWQRKLDAQAEAATLRNLIAALAPRGIEAMAQAVADLRAVLARPQSVAAARVDRSDVAALEETRRRRRIALQTAEAAGAEARDAQAVRAQSDRELATLEERAASARREQETIEAELLTTRRQATDEALVAALEAAEAELRAAAASEAATREALEATDPEILRLKLMKAQRAEAAIRADVDTLARETRDLRIELSALGRDGVGEQLAEVQGRLDLARRRVGQAEREARAARLLHDSLVEAQRESKERWLGPVRQRVRPYLRLLDPDSDVVLNEETLEIEGVLRAGRPEPFEALSMGAREQVAVITRLALADILRTSQRPSAVILDDALVNTDETRLDRMHLVLHRAAEHLQVMVLTCRERDFLQLGAPVFRMG